MSSAPDIFNCDDTVWVANEKMVESTSLHHDYSNVTHSTIENLPKSIPYETLDSSPKIIIIIKQSLDHALMNYALENPLILILDETFDSPPQKIITNNQYPSALMDSEGLQLESLNHIAIDSISSKNSNVSLFQVMKFILRLCNQIVPSVVENQCPNIIIDFNSLNQLSMPTMGFYGDNQMMGILLKEMGVIEVKPIPLTKVKRTYIFMLNI